MRNISFSLTEPQFLDGSKTVTRRLGWKFLQIGDHLMACRKCMGLKPGQKIVRLGEIVVTGITHESLLEMVRRPRYGKAEAKREGFPYLSGTEFVAMFCEHMQVPAETRIIRIQFRRIANV